MGINPTTGNVGQTSAAQEAAESVQTTGAAQEAEGTGAGGGQYADAFDATPSSVQVQIQAMEGDMSPEAQAFLNSLSASSQGLMGTFGPPWRHNNWSGQSESV